MEKEVKVEKMPRLYKCLDCEFNKGFHEFCCKIDCAYNPTSAVERFRDISNNFKKVDCPKIK